MSSRSRNIDNCEFRELTDALPLIVWSASADGQIDYGNRAWNDRMGVLAEASFVSSYGSLVHPQDRPRLSARWHRSLRTGGNFEHKHRLADPHTPGNYRWHHARATPILDENGSITRWIGTSSDIHDLRLANDACRASEDKYLKLIDITETGYVAVDSNGRVIEANAAYVKLTGHEELQQIKGRPVTDWTAPTDAARNAAAVKLCAKVGNVRQLEIDYVQPDGRHVPVEINATALETERGIISMALCRDISQRRQAQEALQRQRIELAHLARVNTMGQLATGLAHELTQPLGAILNYTGACRDLLDAARPGVPDDLVLQALAEIEREGRRAGDIIRRLRALVRKHEPRSRPIDLNREIADVINLLAFELREAHVRARLELDEHLPQVLCDEVEVQQVMVNLVRNAIDAVIEISGQREIVIRTRLESGKPVVQVCDNGTGIPEDRLESIFDAFYTTKRDGLGMGLAICRTILHNHGGKLTASSVPGKTTFTFTLPSAEANTHGELTTRNAA